MLDRIEQKSIIFWQEQEQAVVLTRWNGSIELRQGKNSIALGEGIDIDELIKALKECREMSWERI